MTQLYGGKSPLGQVIRISGQPYEVVGVLATKGQSAMGQDQDDTVVIPLKTYVSKLDKGMGKYITRGQIFVSTATEADISRLRSVGYEPVITPLEEAVADYVQNYLVPGRHLESA